MINDFSIPQQKTAYYNHKLNGTIADAINEYERRGVPLRQLLSDYLDVITYPDELQKAINPWQHINTGIKSNPTVCGVSVAETLYNVAAMSLYRQNPISVIKSIYYRNKNRNDSALERIFLNSIQDSIAADQRVLIMNPSPFVVESVEKSGRNTVYATIDQTMVGLYSKQFKHSEFVSIDNIHSISGADVIILFATNIADTSLQKILEYIGTVHTDRIYGIIQNRMLDNKESMFWQALSAGHFAIHSIVILPNDVSNSKPRKKCLIIIERKADAETLDKESSVARDLIIQRMEYDSSDKTVYLTDQKLSVSQEELMRCKTLNQLWKRVTAEELEEAEEEGKKETVNKSAELYAFSREIQISYAIYRDYNGCYAKAYYAATKYTHLPEVRGKALTSRAERGLRAKTVDRVIDALEKIPFIMMLGITMIAAPGVPGGGVMAALGILEVNLGFDENMLTLMIALYIAQDSFGTACNVTGDGAMAAVIDAVSGRWGEME